MLVHCIELFLLISVELIEIGNGFILHTFSIATINMYHFLEIYAKNVSKDYLDVSSQIFKLKEKDQIKIIVTLELVYFCDVVIFEVTVGAACIKRLPVLIQALTNSQVTILGSLNDGVNKLGKSRLSISIKEPGAKANLWSENLVLICRDDPERFTYLLIILIQYSILTFTFQMGV